MAKEGVCWLAKRRRGARFERGVGTDKQRKATVGGVVRRCGSVGDASLTTNTAPLSLVG